MNLEPRAFISRTLAIPTAPPGYERPDARQLTGNSGSRSMGSRPLSKVELRNYEQLQ
jgi:hypothetical protein